ncbi:type II toxin-antitoxin system RelE family toxin [Candidatus Solincola sp.]|nr:type II toxin-antitoxin system RelE/ParE family toxin [Actinomycetota bacterium]MDI7251055.1 type II toxin-antitoxin system RelE/ParE family toxin [Actinomycetota bacterium]
MASKRYRIIVPKGVAGAMKRLPQKERERLFAAIASLEHDPRPRGCVKLHLRDMGEYRLRVGDFRIMYDVDDAERTVEILAVKRRREAYKG